MPEGTSVEALAGRAMALARDYIVLRLRFLDMAVFRLRPVSADTTLATDGRHLFYGDKHVLRRYMKADQAGLARDCLHALLHCVFRHPFIDSLVEDSRWDLACDIAVESVILSLEDAGFKSPEDAARRRVIEALSEAVRPLTAEKLYRYFADHAPEPSWAGLFMTDEHALWHRREKRADGQRQPGGGDDGEDGGEGGGPRGANPERMPEEPEDKAPGSQGGEAPEKGEQRPDGQEAAEASRDDGDGADDAGASSRFEVETGDEDRKARSMRAAEASEGRTGRSEGRYDEKHQSGNRSTGRGMDTEGRDGMAAGSQSRSDRTGGGLDAPHSLGTGGDSADAASQSDASSEGGSGSGLNDALITAESGATPREAALEDRRREDENDALEREWRDVGERIQTDLETLSRRQGMNAAAVLAQLGEINREKIDYAAFLRRFTVLGEVAELNDDEFEHIFYTYGLRLYGNLPLIEPMETREVKRVRDFVIAIDTSGSTSGKLVKKFLEKTRAILKGEENFFRKINLYLVQCDARVQEAVRITGQEEFDAYLEGMAVKGLGGTDFRPVFQYVDDLLAQGAFTRLKGLIYFTDGMGTYPARKPDYETAFVFLRESAELPPVPPWAIRVVLEPEDI